MGEDVHIYCTEWVEAVADSDLQIDYRFSSTMVGLLRWSLAKQQYTWTPAKILIFKY